MAEPEAQAKTYTRDNPYWAKLKAQHMLSMHSSAKDTRHYVVDLADSGLTYEVGDSLAIMPTNDPELVNDILDALSGPTGEEIITGKNGEITFRQALMTELVVTEPHTKLVKAIAERSEYAGALHQLLLPEKKDQLNDYLDGRGVIDLLREFPDANFTAEEFPALCKKLVVRLYSIASSQKAHPTEVHLTVDTVRYTTHDRLRKGVCSVFLAERVGEEVAFPVFVQATKTFKLPEDGNVPIIMVGPGTGVAPFRAFLEERIATGAGGKSWLFFGAQHQASDYFYREEFEAWLAEGKLTKISLAWSRDQADKVYVQHKMHDAGEEIWAWLQEGAHFFVCGDAKYMAKDVDETLHHIISKHGGMDAEQATAYVKQMKADKRYKRDVY
jgi:sulfite reductase (NADPH) flavoprotein alpha-component